MKIRTNYLPETQYIKKSCSKSMVVLHHTVSGGSAEAVRDWFNSTKERVAVAFVIDKQGNILKLYEPEYWAYHIGKGSNDEHNKKSIGIEIVNEGALTSKDGEYYWYDGKHKYKGKVYAHDNCWRGYRFFAEYTEEQTIAAGMLVGELIRDFGIPPKLLIGYNYAPENYEYNGILNHHNLRPDKSDLSPAFDYQLFLRAMK
jgi:N-acetyl-anhydromuramyl-L-alanine amidase AmpD